MGGMGVAYDRHKYFHARKQAERADYKMWSRANLPEFREIMRFMWEALWRIFGCKECFLCKKSSETGYCGIN